MHGLAPLIYDLTIMLGMAAIVVLLFQRIRQPVVLGYLVAGIIIGPHTPPYSLLTEMKDIQALSELGVIFLMFSLGLEFSFHKLLRVGFSASVTGLVEVTLMLLVGYGLGILLGWQHESSLFLGAALSISSTTIIIKAMDELKLKKKHFAELVYGVLIVEDLLAIILLAMFSTIAVTENMFSVNMLLSILQLFLVVGAWFIVGYFVVPSMFRHIARYISAETLTIVSVALCLLLVVSAARFHYSTALGAFIMGSIMAETTLVHRVEELIKPIRDIFAAVFFISIGMMIDPVIIIEQWQLVLLVASITVIGKIATTSIGALLTGQSVTTSLRVGFSMGQIGEFSFIIAGLGAAMGLINSTLFPLIVAVSGVTTFTTPYLIRFSGYVSNQIDKNLPDRIKYFLLNYSTWVARATASTQHQPWFRRISIRLIINGIIVIMIFMLTNTWINPYVGKVFASENVADMVSLMIALGLSLPFIWGMLFSYRAEPLPAFGKTRVNPAISIIWLLTFAELAILSLAFFQTWLTMLIIATIATILFVYGYQHVEKSYQWFERQFVANVQHLHEDHNDRYEALAPWDNHLVELHVDLNSSFVHRSLTHCHIREKYGINVVAICHGTEVIAAPRGNEVIRPLDRLIVLGNDEQIDLLRQKLEVAEQAEEAANSFLEGFVLKSLLITKRHSFIGKSIRDAGIRERVNGMVVGMERNGERILNPAPDTILQAEDLLMIVGVAAKMQQL